MTRFKSLCLLLVILAGGIFWWFSQPTKITDVYYSKQLDNYYVIVKHFPVTKKSKIRWWEKNKSLFKEKYHVPVGESDYGISFWTGNYRVDNRTDEDSDLLCFDEIETRAKCIEKDHRPMKIWYRKDKDETIYLFDK